MTLGPNPALTPQPPRPRAGEGVNGRHASAVALPLRSVPIPVREGSVADRASTVVSYMRRNPSLPIGLAMLLALGIFLIVGRFMVNLEDARAISVATLQEPSAELPFGSDRQGRNLFAVMI